MTTQQTDYGLANNERRHAALTMMPRRRTSDDKGQSGHIIMLHVPLINYPGTVDSGERQKLV